MPRLVPHRPESADRSSTKQAAQNWLKTSGIDASEITKQATWNIPSRWMLLGAVTAGPLLVGAATAHKLGNPTSVTMVNGWCCCGGILFSILWGALAFSPEPASRMIGISPEQLKQSSLSCTAGHSLCISFGLTAYAFYLSMADDVSVPLLQVACVGWALSAISSLISCWASVVAGELSTIPSFSGQVTVTAIATFFTGLAVMLTEPSACSTQDCPVAAEQFDLVCLSQSGTKALAAVVALAVIFVCSPLSLFNPDARMSSSSPQPSQQQPQPANVVMEVLPTQGVRCRKSPAYEDATSGLGPNRGDQLRGSVVAGSDGVEYLKVESTGLFVPLTSKDKSIQILSPSGKPWFQPSTK